jgi:hypothetical protein
MELNINGKSEGGRLLQSNFVTISFMNKNLKVLIICTAVLSSTFIINSCSISTEESYNPGVSSTNIASENKVNSKETESDNEETRLGESKEQAKSEENTGISNEKTETTNEGSKVEEVILNKIDFKVFDQSIFNKLRLKYKTQTSGVEREKIDFKADDYANLKGVTCFRGNNMRDGASYGDADISEKRLEIVWEKRIGAIDNWTGVGWNGQPAVVQWDRNTVENMNINSDKKQKAGNLKEVIYAALDGNVYFLDLEDGSDTRDKLRIGAPIKGSVTIDPRGYPLLYVGQGINKNGRTKVNFAYRIFSLTDYKKLFEIKGNDSFARRSWGAFDSTALVDKATDSLFICGENGVLYSGKLNTSYKDGNISISPKLDKYRYDLAKSRERGIENSIAIYENYGFFADNDGVLQCIDLNTLKPVWFLDVKDDTDSTVVLDRDEEGLSLYTACEVDKQRNNGYSYVRKVDAATGMVLWENKYRCAYYDGVNGGALATPVLGKGDISNLVIYNIARTPTVNSGYLIAFDKKSGKEVWKLKLQDYGWSSPVALYHKDGKSYIVQCDSTGKTFLIEGISGKILDTIDLGSNVEGSPSAFENMLVVGTRGGKIVGFKVK